MAKFSRTWWGDRFIQALEAFTDDNRVAQKAHQKRDLLLGTRVQLDDFRRTSQARYELIPFKRTGGGDTRFTRC
ncbi:hypothetical protein LC605_27615 [Nostoc sp. CHAB 5836]|uniref:hypothetical protein n=1 Tax=Nostoc sp. CHAB 5836 TaxID=2780404 RepID=UPI001E522E1C|nr:hypothetical protein [Nostoc sp. CHAB 5836]MCC5618788.1 hypothetical protein [Nostoc sp. CHAB 5836]